MLDFPHAGVAGKGGYLSSNQLPQPVQALAGLGAHLDGGEPGLLIDGRQILARDQIALVDADDALTAVALGNGRHPVDEKRVGDRDGLGGDDDQLVDVGHRRAVELVLPGQDGLQGPLSVGEGGELHPVPHQRGDLGVAELSPPPAWDDGLAVVHVVEAAEGF